MVILLSPKDKISSINPVTGKNLIFEHIYPERLSGKAVKVSLINYSFSIDYDPILFSIQSTIRHLPWYQQLSSVSNVLNLTRKRLNQIKSIKKAGPENSKQLYFDSLGIKPDDQVTWVIDNNLKIESSKTAKYNDLEGAFYYAYLKKYLF